MRILFGIFLGVLLLFVFIRGYKESKDLFSPLCIFSLFQFIRYVPHLIAANDDSFISLNDRNLLPTFFLECMFVVSTVSGYELFKKRNNAHFSKKSVQNIEIPLIIIIVVFLIGLLSRFYLIHSIGGLSYVLNNMGSAYYDYAHNSSGYVVAIGYLMTLAILMLIHKISLHKKNRLPYYILLMAMLALSMLSYFVYSSRSPALEILMITVFGYHYLIKRITFKTLVQPWFLLLLLAIVIVVCILPSLRQSSSGNSTISLSNVDWAKEISSNVQNIFNEFSVVERDTFVYQYVDYSKLWLGTNFLNLFVAIVPSSIYINKPCIDDGNYLANIIHGVEVWPNMGRNDLPIKYSMPFSTPSCMYINFGFLGIVFGGFVLGIVFDKAYSILKKDVNPFTIFFYQLIVYQLELTTLSISQTLVPIAVSLIAYYFILLVFKKNKYFSRPSLASSNK